MGKYRIVEKTNYKNEKRNDLQMFDGDGWLTLHTVNPKQLDRFIAQGGDVTSSKSIERYTNNHPL